MGKRMAAAFYKILYDLSYYYALTVFLLFLFQGKTVPAGGFVLLAACASLFLFAEFQTKSGLLCRALFAAGLLLGLTGAAFIKGSFLLAQFFAGYLYLLVTVLKKQYYAYYLNLQTQTKAALGLYGVLFLFSMIKIEAAVPALALAAPYLALFCTLAVLLFRLLRTARAKEALQKTPEYFKKQAKQMAGFFLVCLLFTMGKVLLFVLLAGFRLLGRLIRPLLVPLGLLWQKLSALLADLLADMKKFEAVRNEYAGEAEQATQMPFPDYSGPAAPERVTDSGSLFVLFAVIVTAAVLFAAFKLLRGAKKPQRQKEAVVETRERLTPEKKKRRGGIAVRKGARQTVKDCYAEFLKLCKKKRIGRSVSDTSAEVYEKYRQKAGAAEGKRQAAEELSALYREAKYRESREIEESMAVRAKQLLKKLTS